MAHIDELTRQLDALEDALPAMIEDNPEPGDFWMAFAGKADLIADQAGEHAAMVGERIQAMLAEHGRYIAVVDDAI